MSGLENQLEEVSRGDIIQLKSEKNTSLQPIGYVRKITPKTIKLAPEPPQDEKFTIQITNEEVECARAVRLTPIATEYYLSYFDTYSIIEKAKE